MTLEIGNQDINKFIVIGDRILIKPKTTSDRTKGGLILPPGVQEKENIQSGYVVKVGPGYPIPVVADSDEPWKNKTEEVKYVPLQPKEGDLAVYLQNNSWEIEFNGRKVFYRASICYTSIDTRRKLIRMKTAIITGGAQGIGRQVSESLLKNDYHVIIAEKDEEAGKEAVEYLQHFGTVLFVSCDISKEAEVKHMTEETIRHFGQLDVLINNAAIMIHKSVTELTLEEWNEVIGANLTGAFLCSKYAVPYLKKTRGNIINMASTRAFMSEKDTESYSASKGGIYSLTHALAISLGPDVRVNCISPGWIEVSDLKKNSVRKEPELSEDDHLQHPAGRVGKATDIASMILFLIAPENSFITGQNFIIDGGMTRKMIYV